MTTEKEEFKQVDGTFEFFDIVPADAKSIAALIPKYLPCNRHQLATIIANQRCVGSTIKSGSHEDEAGQSLFGFVTCLNLGQYVNHQCILSIRDWLTSLGNPSLCELLSNSLHTIGLLISERAHGVPDALAPHLCRSIFSEIEWATEDLETEDERCAFGFTHYILVKKANKGDDGLDFPLVEDEIIFNHAQLKIEFQTAGEPGDLADLEYHRYVLVLTAESVPLVRQEVNEMFDVNEEDYAHEGQLD
jgi:hypothetical protein